jgi:NADH-quinone oxidoreductase subunit N
MAAAALFKLGAVPLHWWLPDVYEAAAPEVAGFLSTAMKAAAVLLLMRVCALAPDAAFARALPMLGGMTALFGSLFALRQKALQRLLAYSSLAHAGFLILGVGAWCALGRDGSSTAALLLYLAAYAFLSNGAFIFLSASGLKTREQLRGYAGGEPVLAAAFAVLLFSLGGVPPTGGFIAKFVIFWQAIRAGFSAPLILAAISSIVSLSYYLALVRDLYFEAPSGAPAQEGRPVARIAVLVCALGALFMGAAPLLLNQLGAGAGR